MNKEVKAIVEYLEEEREAIRTKCYYPDDVLNCEDLIMLMDYINQLETNIEEALKTTKELYEEGVEWHWDNGSLEMYVLDLLSILERGKE